MHLNILHSLCVVTCGVLGGVVGQLRPTLTVESRVARA